LQSISLQVSPKTGPLEIFALGFLEQYSKRKARSHLISHQERN